MNMNTWTIYKDIATVLIAAFGALAAISAYRKNANTRRAEFLCDLHKAFFVDGTYRETRKLLDSNSEKATIERSRLVRQEPETFIDFLNFFELVAYLEQCRNLSLNDVKALLGYYLDLLRTHSEIRAYIQDERKGFEQLRLLFDKLDKLETEKL